MKILLVDDDILSVEALTVGMSFQHPNWETLSATDGQTALDHFRDHRPDLVILDISLPDRDGFEILRAIRAVSEVPVIILTGHGQAHHRERAFELGATDHVVK